MIELGWFCVFIIKVKKGSLVDIVGYFRFGRFLFLIIYI